MLEKTEKEFEEMYDEDEYEVDLKEVYVRLESIGGTTVSLARSCTPSHAG